MTYCTVADLLAYVRTDLAVDEPEAAVACDVATSDINTWCQRTFVVPTAATTRTFVAPKSSDLLLVHDIADTTDLVIVHNGSTLTASQYQLEVFPGVTSQTSASGLVRPYTWVRLLGGVWSHNNGAAAASIIARWGWPVAAPPQVPLAAKMLGRDMLNGRDTRFGVASFGPDGYTRRITSNGQVVALLERLRSPWAGGEIGRAHV